MDGRPPPLCLLQGPAHTVEGWLCGLGLGGVAGSRPFFIELFSFALSFKLMKNCFWVDYDM